MLFNSVDFVFVFLPVCIAAFALARGVLGRSAGMVCILCASFVFYVYWKADHIILLVASIAFNFGAGSLIAVARERHRMARAKALLAVSLAANLATLGIFKYSAFAVASANETLGTGIPLPEIALPLGISFFTFTQITFLVDTYRLGGARPNPLNYALFVTFFPHLVAGPILKYRDIDSQLSEQQFGSVRTEQFAAGAAFFVIGMVKKVVLADPIGSYVGPVFAAARDHGEMTFWEAWAGALAYTFQIYFDFSGYCDMAIGLGLMFGLRLPVNFDSPYKAIDIVDFWRRWHITLSEFLRDYLYVPLGGNRRGAARRYANIVATMVLGGLWHGANWTFVLWGLIHAALIGATHLAAPLVRGHSMLRAALGRITTFSVIVLTWVPFRADSVDAALVLWARMLDVTSVALPSAVASPLGLSAAPMFGNGLLERGDCWPLQMMGLSDRTLACIVAIAILATICFWMPNSQRLVGYDPKSAEAAAGARSAVMRQPALAGLAFGAVFLVCMLSIDRPSTFLYFNF